jgi:hypothetical protein
MGESQNRYYWRNREERKAAALAYYFAHREFILAKWRRQRAERTPEEREAWRTRKREDKRAERLKKKAKQIAAQAGEPVEEPGVSYRLKREI